MNTNNGRTVAVPVENYDSRATCEADFEAAWVALEAQHYLVPAGPDVVVLGRMLECRPTSGVET